MLNSVKLIYNKFHNGGTEEIPTSQLIKFLTEQLELDPHNSVYQQCVINLSSLRVNRVLFSFIERFCLDQLITQILTNYPVNIAEGFVLGYLILNNEVDLHHLYFKLGNSGLITSTIIDGKTINDIEAIAQFIINSLSDADLVYISNNKITLGQKFQLC